MYLHLSLAICSLENEELWFSDGERKLRSLKELAKGARNSKKEDMKSLEYFK